VSAARNCRGTSYQVVVVGHLESHWSEWLGGMAIQNLSSGEAVLSGPLADQAMLHGLLAKLRDLGLPIVSVRRLDSSPENTRREV
jgi:hypothetical protein